MPTLQSADPERAVNTCGGAGIAGGVAGDRVEQLADQTVVHDPDEPVRHGDGQQPAQRVRHSPGGDGHEFAARKFGADALHEPRRQQARGLQRRFEAGSATVVEVRGEVDQIGQAVVGAGLPGEPGRIRFHPGGEFLDDRLRLGGDGALVCETVLEGRDGADPVGDERVGDHQQLPAQGLVATGRGRVPVGAPERIHRGRLDADVVQERADLRRPEPDSLDPVALRCGMCPGPFGEPLRGAPCGGGCGVQHRVGVALPFDRPVEEPSSLLHLGEVAAALQQRATGLPEAALDGRAVEGFDGFCGVEPVEPVEPVKHCLGYPGRSGRAARQPAALREPGRSRQGLVQRLQVVAAASLRTADLCGFAGDPLTGLRDPFLGPGALAIEVFHVVLESDKLQPRAVGLRLLE